MEKRLERVMDDVMACPNVNGCIFANHQGLCLGAKGKASTESAGVMVAIAEQAGKLEPHSKSPVILLENDTKSCVIHRNGTITGAIYKTNHS